MNEQKLQEQVALGRDAEIARRMTEKVCKELEVECWNTFKISDVHDSEGHASLRYYLKVLTDFRERIDQYIIAGKSAQAEISHGAKQNESS